MTATVAELLYQSLAAHQRAKQQLASKDGRSVLVKARDMAALREAYELRKQALALDPERADPAWQDEQAKTPRGRDTHAELMSFYREKLG